MRELIAFMPGKLHLDTVLMGMGTAVADLEGFRGFHGTPFQA